MARPGIDRLGVTAEAGAVPGIEHHERAAGRIVDAPQHPAAERGDVVPDASGEQDVQPVELTVVEQVPVQREQLGDRGPVVRTDRHR